MINENLQKHFIITEETLPTIPLRGLSVLPHNVLSFDVGREKSLKALEMALAGDERIFIITQKDAEVEEPSVEDLEKTGLVCTVKQYSKLGEDSCRLIVEAGNRGIIKEFDDSGEYISSKVEIYEFDDNKLTEDEKNELEAFSRKLMDCFEEYINIGAKISRDSLEPFANIEGFSKFVDTLASAIYMKIEKKQQIIDTIDIFERMELILKMILEETQIVRLEKKIALRVRKQVSKLQKDYYLREQLRAIQKELGEDENTDQEADKYRAQLKKMKAPKEVKDKISKEIEKFARGSQMNPETSVTRNYLDTIFSLPWNKYTKDKIDIVRAKEVLDEDHYGLDEVKDRIIEFLAVRKISKKLKSPIVCLVGPPGVGKTSIAKSVARAVGRKFVRLSLGGVRDEAEIRGHRRTYIGAIPGRIINGMKEANSKNPVFLLDEIDKMSMDFKGDPASAMLEVLDPEQNKTFVDHYLELPFDLSNVMFITTANSMKGIPGPLRDRMEVIEVGGYIEQEKLQIAKRYLIPKQVKNHGLEEGFMTIDDEVLSYIISDYTRESGVRWLERNIGKVCRKVVKKYVENPDMEPVKVSKADVDEYLGDKVFEYEKFDDEPQIGCVNGMAWTQVGGVSLKVEVNVLKGKGNVVLTGKLGDVMKESATAAISYIRSRAEELSIDPDFYQNKDIHIHLPEGAVPKDGPSAGITMALAVISALTERPVPSRIAMTGEITLRGRVLAVGGIREKVLAAHRSGAKIIIMPKSCERDMEKIPDEVKKDLEFHLVENMDEVIEIALLPKEGEAK